MKNPALVKIFGREPALWLALVAIVVKLATAFGLDLTNDQQAVVNAVAAALTGLIVAISVHDGIGAGVLSLVQAGLALAVGFGLHWSPEQQATVLALASGIVAMWTRTQVTAKVPAGPVAPTVELTGAVDGSLPTVTG